MAIGTRVSTSIQRSYLYDARFNSIADPLAREAYLRAKLQADNLGRLPGDADTLRGLLFPLGPPSLEAMGSIVKAWVRGGLVLRYKVGRCFFIEIADNGSTMRLVGRMTDRSEFPEPPNNVVKKWEKRFGMKRVQLRNPNVGKNPVHTESIPSIAEGKSEGSQKRSEEKRTEGSAEGNHNTGAGAPVGSDEPTFSLSDLGRGMTICDKLGFDRKIGFKGYEEKDRFLQELSNIWKPNEVPAHIVVREQIMGHVVNRCGGLGFKVPPGWIKLLNDVRREIKKQQGVT